MRNLFYKKKHSDGEPQLCFFSLKTFRCTGKWPLNGYSAFSYCLRIRLILVSKLL